MADHRQYQKGQDSFYGLDREARDRFGDALVLDDLDWDDWFEIKPSLAFRKGFTEAWEQWQRCGAP